MLRLLLVVASVVGLAGLSLADDPKKLSDDEITKLSKSCLVWRTMFMFDQPRLEEKSSIGPPKRPVKELNGPIGTQPQAPSV